MNGPHVRNPRIAPRLAVLGVASALVAAIALADDPAHQLQPAAYAIDHHRTPPRPASGSSCVSCHRVEPDFSHPVGFAPSRTLPDHFPLEHGLMTCNTCHDASDPQRHRGADGDPLLRSPLQGAAFCNECHDATDTSSDAVHALAVSRAHLLWPDRRRARQDPFPAGGSHGSRTLDAESASCMQCHDGSIAADVGSKARGPMLAGEAQDHPVGIPYDPRAHPPGDGMRRLVHPDSLDHRVRLFGGAVGCGSCHSVYSPHDDYLVMRNDASRLCLSCHSGQ